MLPLPLIPDRNSKDILNHIERTALMPLIHGTTKSIGEYGFKAVSHARRVTLLSELK
jgi:hypothetical protein